MDNPLITIAIPAYNNEKTIQTAIDSCLAQNTKINYEILIADDASIDGTPNILAKYNDPKIRLLTLEKRVSLIDNHNVCLKNAKAKYVVFCHADDSLEPNAIEILADTLKKRKYPQKYIVWGHSMFRDFAKHIKRADFALNEIIVGEYAPLVFMFGGVTPSGTCYCKDSILELGGFLQTNHRLAPFDLTSMIYFSIKGFRFEMIDEMILMRLDASTATLDTPLEEILDARDDAYRQVLQMTEKNDIDKLLNISLTLSQKPFNFYYALAQDSRFKKRIKTIFRNELIRHPLLIRKKIVRKLIQRLISS